ncbi:MAG TPA: maleylpyruvate isomerase family mycothiol-dependent enzyme [Acidimicrobiales bacterium]|nr:maleylpyruvate isomerase family mycothiol-dependent enzyme [Acidimicrobiales bacterium]
MAGEMTMMWDEVADIGELLHELDDAAYDTPSLCQGWAVRDVLGHMGLGHTVPMGAMVARIGRYRFNVTKASFAESKTLFAGTSPEDIRRFWDEVMVAQHPRKGISKLIPTKAGFLDHLVHNQDIRRPTGKPRVVPEERLRRALELVRSEGTPMFNPKRNVAGLRLHATDVDWSAGDGPLVEGPGEAIVLAASGRSAVLGDLSGDGLATLRQRIAA